MLAPTRLLRLRSHWAPKPGDCVLAPVACPDCGGNEYVYDSDPDLEEYVCDQCDVMGMKRADTCCPHCGKEYAPLPPLMRCTQCGCLVDSPPVSDLVRLGSAMAAFERAVLGKKGS